MFGNPPPPPTSKKRGWRVSCYIDAIPVVSSKDPLAAFLLFWKLVPCAEMRKCSNWGLCRKFWYYFACYAVYDKVEHLERK